MISQPPHKYQPAPDPWEQKFPPADFPGLYLSPSDFSALRRRQRRRRELLQLLGPDIADIAVAVTEERTHGQRV
jgi:hypothetical protein